jgi:hypothetical protein
MHDTQDYPAVVRSSDEMEIRNSGEFHRETVGTLQEPKQVHESCMTVSNIYISCILMCSFIFAYIFCSVECTFNEEKIAQILMML